MTPRKLTLPWAAALAALSAALFGPSALAQEIAFANACESAPSFAENFTAPDIRPHWTTIVHPAIANPNGELQAYQSQAIAAGPHGLRIIATRRGATISSGRIASKAAFRFGCFDIVARMPSGRGLWPALWLRTPYDRPIDGEIDIMEGFGSHPGLIQSTLHHWTHGSHHGFDCTRIGDAASATFRQPSICHWQPGHWRSDFTTAPHHFGLIWTPQALTWLIDGRPYFTLRSQIPDQTMNIHLNLAVGGLFDGDPDASTPFPAILTVRSVTVWPLRH